MDSIRWERIQTLFHEAAELPKAQRLAFINSAAAGDPALAASVAAMLEEDDNPSSILEPGGLEGVARRVTGPTLPDQDFGPYRIQKLLGEGGMGVVYLARREDLGSWAAIKLLPDAWMSPARLKRFAQEQKTLAQLTHPSIARLYDSDTLPDGTPWFAMEYVEGIALTDYCRQHDSSIVSRLALLRAVCEAVQHAHSHAVIHRDLKPSNILVQGDGRVKLVDFGIAKQLDPLDSAASQTRTSMRLMTPAYAAPEQLRGERPSVFTDVYALGVSLYELLTGQLPFDLSRCTPTQADAIIVGREPEKPSAVAKGQGKLRNRNESWDDLDVLCLTAMHKDPERRYRSVEALIRDIDHYLAGEPLETRADSASYRVRKFFRRNRRPVAAFAVVFAAMVGLIVFYTVRLTSARNAALEEAARTQRVLRFTLNLFNGGDKEAGPSSDLRVAALVDRGVAEARSLDRDPAVQAEMNQTLGGVYQKLGHLDRAESLMLASLDRRRSLFGPSHPLVAESMVSLGLLRSEQARFDEAERLTREALQIATRSRQQPAIAAATHAVGKVLEDRGSYQPAIQVLQEAVRLRSTPGASQADLADSLLELANAQFYMGHYADAQSLNERLIGIHEQLFGNRHPLVAEDLINLGAIQQDIGHYKEAEAFERRAVDISEGFYGKDHYKTAGNLTVLSRALVYQKRFDEATDLLHRALTIQEKAFGPVHPRVAGTLNELASVALQRDHYGEAEAAFRRVVEIYKAVYSEKHYTIGIALANLGSVYLSRKENARAEALFGEALEMYSRTLPPEHVNVAITNIKLGRALLRQHRYLEAEGQTLAGYRILSKQAVPSVSWLKSARTDLIAIYTALHQPERAKEFQGL